MFCSIILSWSTLLHCKKSVRVLGGTMRLAIPPLYLFPDVLNDIEIFGIEFEYDLDKVVFHGQVSGVS